MSVLRHILLVATLVFSGVSLASADSTQKHIVLDVRTPGEFQDAHLKGATHIDVLAPGFNEKVAELPKDKAYKVYCRSGARSGRAVEIMKQMGFKNVENIGGLADAAKSLMLPCEGPKSCS